MRAANRRPERLGAARVLRLGELYRATSADLALARRRLPGDPVVARLERLVSDARSLVYASRPSRPAPIRFLTTGYFELIAARPWQLLASTLLLFGPLIVTALWAHRQPEAALALVPDGYGSIVEPRESTDLGLSPAEHAAMSSQIFTNNIRVTLFAFAGGVTLGIVTGALLVFNGLLFGTLTGLAISAGNLRPFTELIVPHGVLELSCIAVAGAAGLAFGWSIVHAGPRPRRIAVGEEARASVAIALGTAPWLVLAGLIEGFVTPSGFGIGPALAVGFAAGGLYWALVLWRGGVLRRRVRV